MLTAALLWDMQKFCAIWWVHTELTGSAKLIFHPVWSVLTNQWAGCLVSLSGLSPAEVSEAIHRSGLQEADGAALAKIQPSANMALATVESAAPVTVMSRAKDFGVLMLVLGGVSYGIYQLLEVRDQLTIQSTVLISRARVSWCKVRSVWSLNSSRTPSSPVFSTPGQKAAVRETFSTAAQSSSCLVSLL